jgi:hypothetical protein
MPVRALFHCHRPSTPLLAVPVLAMAALLWALLPVPAQASPAAGQPYAVDVWADALFGPDGQLQRLDVPEADQYPPAFVAQLKQRFAKARIPPVSDDNGAPATFQTGLGLDLVVTPGADGAAGAVRIAGMRVAARPVLRYTATTPAEVPVSTPGHSGTASVTLRCTVTIEGRCEDIEVVQIDAGSESFRRWGLASMAGWRFEPQRVNGKPVTSQAQHTLELRFIDNAPKDFRDPLRIR